MRNVFTDRKAGYAKVPSEEYGNGPWWSSVSPAAVHEVVALRSERNGVLGLFCCSNGADTASAMAITPMKDALGFAPAEVVNENDENALGEWNLVTAPLDLLEEDREILERWEGRAEKGELDVYTCLGLSIGGSKSVNVLQEMTPTLIALLALQLMVPAFTLLHQAKKSRSWAETQELYFRVVGFCLYLYSLWNMYRNAHTECREIFVKMGFKYNFPLRYLWPAVLGEAINAFTAFTLSLTLFTVFCTANAPQDLIINCIAINFIGSVDSEFTTEEWRKKSSVLFRDAMVKFSHTSSEDTQMRAFSEKAIEYMLYWLRVVGTLGLGHVLACAFLISHEQLLCKYVPFLCLDTLHSMWHYTIQRLTGTSPT